MMNAALLKDVLSTLEETFDDVKARSMFGAYTIYVSGHVVAVLKGDDIYFKVTNPESYPTNRKYTYQKKERTITTNFVSLEVAIASEEKFMGLIKQALAVSEADNLKEQQKAIRLKDLPNLKYNIEKILNDVGIYDVETLRTVGAEAAYQKLRARNANISTDILLQLEGAVTGVHWMAIPSQRKSTLLSRFPRF